MIRSKAPLRIGLAGGGTDVSPYADMYGGAVLNATISLYAHASIRPLNDDSIIFHSHDLGHRLTLKSTPSLELNSNLDLLKGVYNRIVRDWDTGPLSFELTTFVDAPKGSGLGASSTVTVAVIGAFCEWLSLPLGEYDIAQLAYEIERKDLQMSGGRQDQYAATFGGVNFMEFFADEKVIVNPLRIKEEYLHELENNLLLYYTGKSRLSSSIIEQQKEGFTQKKSMPTEAAHKLKEQATMMKEALLKGRISEIGEILDFGWHFKKQMASSISNPIIDEVYETAKKRGASGAKISGAGGGGFMTIFCPENSRFAVMEGLEKFGGRFERFNFTPNGMLSWSNE